MNLILKTLFLLFIISTVEAGIFSRLFGSDSNSEDSNYTELNVTINFECPLNHTYCIYGDVYETSFLDVDEVLNIPLHCFNAKRVGFEKNLQLWNKGLFGYHHAFMYYYHNCTADNEVLKETVWYNYITYKEHSHRRETFNLLNSTKTVVPLESISDVHHHANRIPMLVKRFVAKQDIQNEELEEASVQWKMLTIR